MKKITTSTGASLEIGMASFSNCLNLKNVIEKELKKCNIDISSIDFKGTNLSALINPILSVDSSSEFIDSFFKVAIKSKYNDEKITRETFENEKSREDYYEVLIEVCKYAVSPFLKGLVSSLNVILPQAIKKYIQK